MKKLFTSVLLTTFIVNAFSQTYWDFSSTTPANVPANITVSNISSSNNYGTVTTFLAATSISSGYAGASGGNNAGLASYAVAGSNTSLDVTLTGTATATNKSNAYLEFTITPTSNYEVSITGISFGARSTGTGPQAFAIRSSKDGYTTNIASGTIPITSNWTLITPTVTAIATKAAITVRIYTYNGIGNAISGTPNIRFDDLIVTTSTVLPVTLKSISASLINNQPQINWETSNETNFDYFVVEKSFDAKNFVEIGSVISNKANNGSAYQYADISKTLNTQFYRLKMVDKDGTFRYSSVHTVNAHPSVSLALYPNPVTNTIILSHPKAIANAAITIISIEGKIVTVQNVQVGATQTSIDATRLIKGNYVISFENNGIISTTQLVKQ
ncbi:T9SS type A sorting domain-containing protein [Parasediminibacterium paludis]|uniref:T9SS type A sorting domain-containing protein n=1 Tax=Parasediminibacterium paludis TaxID=908966 RepID=A0ABV8Q004_9BACT